MVYTEYMALSFNNLKIRSKLMVLYVIAFLVPIVIITVILSFWLNYRLGEWQMRVSRASMLQTASLYQTMLRSTEAMSDSLFVNKTVQDTLLRHYDSVQEVYEQYANTQFLDDFLRTNADVASFRYYTENPTMLDNAYFIKVTDDIKNSLWYRQAKESHGNILWTMKVDDISHKKMLSLVRAVHSRLDNSFIAVLSINIAEETVHRLLKNLEYETLIAINGKLEFSSHDLPDSRRPAFLLQNFSDEVTSVNSIEWNGQQSAALFCQLYEDKISTMVLMQFIPRKVMRTTTMQTVIICLLVMASGAAVSALLLIFFSRYFERRVSYIDNEIKKIVQNDFETGPRLTGSDEFALMFDQLTKTSSNIKTLIDEVYRHKISQEQLLSRQNDIRFKMLASQINPHFLFNTLETIRMQAIADSNKDVAYTIKLLAKILRHNLDVAEHPVPLMEEIDVISNYLEIQHLRFASRVSYAIMFLSPVKDVAILPLLIQPLVENSFSHGLEARTKDGFIYILVDTEGDELTVSVKDNGCGMSKEQLESLTKKLELNTVETVSTSIGMLNVNQRIKLFYGKQYGLHIESQLDKGTTVTIRVPLIRLQEVTEK